MKMGCMLITYNNGTGSRAKDMSKGPIGTKADVDNFLTLCLDSYFQSVWADCPFIVVDDGSTDDSAEIVARYGKKVTRFIRHEKNEGLTKSMNKVAQILISEYGCDAICRFDGDIEFLSPGWDRHFIRCFESRPDVGAVGACQLTPYGALWALGDMLIHPDGYTHVLGFPTHKRRENFYPIFLSEGVVLGNIECDSVMGCLAAFRSTAYQKIGGVRSEFDDLRGETEDLNLRLLLEGYQCLALGGTRFIHRHLECAKKDSSIYDKSEKVKRSYSIWPELWGWDKLRPDLQAIWNKWKGTQLTRNLEEKPDGTVIYIGA